MTVDLPRVRRTLATLDRLLAAHPELRGEGARAAVFLDTAPDLHDREHEADLAPFAAIPPANDR
jgi:hypothetical protein